MRPRDLSKWILLVAVVTLTAAAGCASSRPRLEYARPKQPLSAERPRGPVLFVLTAAAEQRLADGRTRKTGYFLNELYEPLRALREAGHDVVFATPGGRPPALDPEGLDKKYWPDADSIAPARGVGERLLAERPPLSLEEARRRREELQGLVVPGGQGVMVDLLRDPTMHDLLADFGRDDKPVGLICHAPALLTKLDGSRNPFLGRRVTSVSGTEEWFIETFVMGSEARDRGIGDLLEARGYRYHSAFPGRSHAVRDCNLITSQNPFSGRAFTSELLAALDAFRRGSRCQEMGRDD